MKRICMFLMILSLMIVSVGGAFADTSDQKDEEKTVSSEIRTEDESDSEKEDRDDRDHDGDDDHDDDHDEDHDDHDDDHDDDDDEDDDDDDEGGKWVKNSALDFHGELSAYQPRRENTFGLKRWGRITVESEPYDEEAGPARKKKSASGEIVPDYEATYEGGQLRELEVEIELEDDVEYEVVFDSEKRIIRAEYETDDREIYFNGKYWHDEDGNEVDGPDLEFMKKYYDSFHGTGTWYGNNTMSLIGLSLRDLFPKLTDRWYQVVPVDLTKDGVYRFPTAASNMYYLGSCIVTVKDGTVTTDYTLPYGFAYPQSDCLMWFTDFDEITTEFLDAPVGSYHFGEPVSVKDDLKGKKIALLFICNHVTYRVPINSSGVMPIRYYRNNSETKQLLAEFEELVNQMKSQE